MVQTCLVTNILRALYTSNSGSILCTEYGCSEGIQEYLPTRHGWEAAVYAGLSQSPGSRRTRRNRGGRKGALMFVPSVLIPRSSAASCLPLLPSPPVQARKCEKCHAIGRLSGRTWNTIGIFLLNFSLSEILRNYSPCKKTSWKKICGENFGCPGRGQHWPFPFFHGHVFFFYDCFFEFVTIRAYVAPLIIFICDSFTSLLTMIQMNAVLHSYYDTSPTGATFQLHELQSSPTIQSS